MLEVTLTTFSTGHGIGHQSKEEGYVILMTEDDKEDFCIMQ